ncbi:MAG: cell wall hydrolase [Amaricoccus sp.]|uniref:cell wall hydrolase n=1 Tax=Amaricoccus sp. TaxID=1872485 RepID=UPI00331507FD
MRALKTALVALSALASVSGPGMAADAKRPQLSRSSSEVACLAEAIYFEAGGTGAKGQAAVAHVVVNRAQNRKFPNSVCGVVGDGCQFSYKCDGRSDALADAKRRGHAIEVAQAVLSGSPDITNGALFFHSAQAKPGWFKSRPRVGVIGGNVFYR